MNVELSISLTEEQAAYASRLVEEGHFSSLSAVMQEAVELMRQQNEIAYTLSQLLIERRAGEFVEGDEGRRLTEEAIERKRADGDLGTF
ncbi:hypothetical protein AYJ57_21465 (plasmid) [Salipiger sp. CCB-MM3]|uniref:ribbon-helix-helix domain-containing protein n=1 Tax=Salipiger sp. CCB-MM3 TaxID=1792508 RepID=UPI00080AB9AD|nr:hypothetical protein [Salipiger sp. CCB-MM3]ANT63045.1 hypothetical protein AYJ57_21465 [Salipiger sp. CCB-MM3]